MSIWTCCVTSLALKAKRHPNILMLVLLAVPRMRWFLVCDPRVLRPLPDGLVMGRLVDVTQHCTFTVPEGDPMNLDWARTVFYLCIF